MRKCGWAFFHTNTKYRVRYCSDARVLVNLRNEIGLVRRLVSTHSEAQSFVLEMLVVVVGIVCVAGWSADFSEEIDLLAVADRGFSG